MGRSRNQSIEPDVDAALEFDPCSAEQPYRRLWATVLNRAVRDYCDDLSKGGNGSSKIAVWFNSDEAHPGSFAWMCELFNLDVARTRSHVNLNWKTISGHIHCGSKGK